MLEYEWAAAANHLISGSDEPNQQESPDQSRQIFHHYSNAAATEAYHHSFTDHNSLLPPQPPSASLFHHQSNSFFDPRGATTYAAGYATPTHNPSLLSLDHPSENPYFLVPKSEDDGMVMSGASARSSSDFSSRIGLNLGGRTYFSSTEDDFVSRLYRRSRSTLHEHGGGAMMTNAPRCQAEGCTADLTHAKHYHRRHKVCEFHSKASTVLAAGLTQRFCQQCSRFHLLSEFDNGKRSCRKRLADHNRRRRKSNQNNTNSNQSHETLKAPAAAVGETGWNNNNNNNSPSDNLTERSPSESGVQSCSSVTVAVSPPRMFLDCFKQRPYDQATASSSSSASSSSLFFLSG